MMRNAGLTIGGTWILTFDECKGIDKFDYDCNDRTVYGLSTVDMGRPTAALVQEMLDRNPLEFNDEKWCSI